MSAAPLPYERVTSFFSYEATYPAKPKSGAQLDAEFNAVRVALNGALSRLGEIQRDDGKLANGSVHLDALSPEALAVSGIEFTPRGQWLTATLYAAGDMAEFDGLSYIALSAHTSGVFATDRAAGKWQVIAGVPADLQDEIDALSSGISGKQDSATNLSALAGLTGAADRLPYFTGLGTLALATFTGAGRTLAAAADAAAQRTALDLVPGTAANNIVRLDGSARLPAVDGSQLTNVSIPDAAVTAVKLAATLDLSSKTITLPAANTPALTKSYVSAEQTITSGGLLTLAHSLGAAPKLCFLRLVCKTADLGYSVNDVIDVATTGGIDVNGSTRGLIVRSDATNVYVRFGTNAAPLTVLTATGGASASIAIANWRLVVSAYA